MELARPSIPSRGALRRRGLTLVELVVVLAVLALLLVVSVGSLAEMVQTYRLEAASNEVLQQLYLARYEAIKRNRRVTVCKSADGVFCATKGNWEQGWIAFLDRNRNGNREDGELVLGRLHPLPPDMRIRGNNPVSRYISYAPYGNSKMASGAFQAGTLTVCRASAGPTEGRQVVINAMGRPRLQKAMLDECL